MQRKLIVILALFLIGAVSISCGKKEEEATVVITGSYDKSLSELFPQEEGWQWEYTGSANYAHHMHLDKVYEAGSQKVLTLSGEVNNVSSGTTHSDYSLEVTYAIEGDRVVQTKLSDALMDSEYDKVTLIMSPLTLGTSWKETVIDSQGKTVAIQSEIIDVEDHPDGKIYKVVYKEMKSDYSEVRKIQVKQGVIDFVKTMKYADQSLELTYRLNKLSPPNQNHEQNELSTEVDQVKGVIFKFDELWIDYVNQGDSSVMDYVSEESPVAKMILEYQRDETRQKYLSIDIKEVTIDKNIAYAKVYEKMQQTSGSENNIFEYHWIYRLEKKGEMWYIHSYEENQEN